MTTIQNINPSTKELTITSTGTAAGVGAGAALGAGVGYIAKGMPSEDEFVKAAWNAAEEESLQTRKIAAKVLKKMNNNQSIPEKLLKKLLDTGYTPEELANKDNIKAIIHNCNCTRIGANNGEAFKKALTKLQTSTHTDAPKARQALQDIIKRVESSRPELVEEIKTAYKEGTNNNLVKEVMKYMKKKSAGKFAVVGAVALGAAGYFASKYLNIYPKQKNI